MSILIKGMEMPKENRLTLQISADGAIYIVNRCRITTETYTTDAVPVPPHGRLIDADKLLKESEYIVDEVVMVGRTLIPIKEIYNAPTIIEAEDGE